MHYICPTELIFFDLIILTIVTCLVAINGVSIGNWIYCTLTTRNYNLQFTTTQTTLHSLY
jgi:hypothetical protein